jgi:hypothetical protein
MPRAELPAIIPLRKFGEDTWLAPGFIDIQVNGGGDVLFNDEPTRSTAPRSRVLDVWVAGAGGERPGQLPRDRPATLVHSSPRRR